MNLHHDLHQATTTLQLGLDAAREQQLLDYLALLAKWTKVYNLTAVRTPESMLTLHLVDSLAALPALMRQTQGQPTRVLDVGSGGGLPGIAFAIAAPEQLRITCVDTVEKKVRFIAQVGAELGLKNLRAEHARVEQLQAEPFPVITSRAFASLVDFVQLTRHLLAPGGVWMALKGQHPADEIAALPADVEVFHVEQLNVPGLDAQRCIVWMRPKT
ncbi:16S rRNA (guanine(527)-N(7))-methyltransferase RsmG [Inhella gelatinilytica]|uniref:Ribosomal RNA small subunit methyltransferase G n=1 Tax=Inhella gelatinilytica TaxID=2795030 RepID=A0A931NCV2_9BURK|nr:16S rRNA (guanine(527)-N(7))-methyltransferase RsmG [Inhella gelatinilytica]MBH9551929.1 16S rRNA (guanine(527)-N(7))-methyltransferase RsmG [Inhella gelatinilytica]